MPGIRKITSGTLVFSMLFSILAPNFSFAAVDSNAPSSTLVANTITLANSGAYSVDFTFSGSLDAGDVVSVNFSTGAFSTSYTGTTNSLNIGDVSSFPEGDILASGEVLDASGNTVVS